MRYVRDKDSGALIILYNEEELREISLQQRVSQLEGRVQALEEKVRKLTNLLTKEVIRDAKI